VYGTNGRCGSHDTALFKAPGVILGRKGQGPLGVEWCNQDYWVIDTAYTLVPSQPDIDLRYAYYLIKHIGLNHLKDGTSNPTLSRDAFGAQAFPIPPIEVQQQISGFFGCIDDRIDLLRQTNTTLEAIAQALFKSWFVDFDPVHAKAEGREPEAMDAAIAALFPSGFEDSELGPIPKGWRSVLSGTIYEISIGKTPPRKEPHWFTNNAADVAWASIRDMGAGGVFLTSTSEFLTREAVEKFNVRTVPEGSVLMSFKLTVGRLVIADFDMTTNEAIAHFKPKQGSLPQSFLYCFLKSFDMRSLSSTSSIANATNSKAIRNIPILHPGLELAQKFDAFAGPLFETIRVQQRQMLTLESLRDTLLPRLISGKLRLPEIMEPAGAALA
jgi:type I restriction enzyme S subunit